MFSSYSTTPLSSLEESPARSSAPWVWFGFIFAAGFLVAEFVVVFAETEESVANILLMFIAACGFI